MKNHALLYWTIGLLILSACQSPGPKGISPNRFQLLGHKCKLIEIVDEHRIVVDKTCGNHDKDKSITLYDLEGNMRELYCNDLYYQIDSIGPHGGYFISAYDRNDHKCFGFHILDQSTYWVVTPLKIGPGINDHFTRPVIYGSSETEDPINFSPTLDIYLPEMAEGEIIYLAYDQKGVKNSTATESGGEAIVLKETSNIYKTELAINPAYYAFEQYRFYFTRGEKREIPTIYDHHYVYYYDMEEAAKEAFHRQYGIVDEFIVVSRFNPSRKREVWKTYGEHIMGQVQDFEYVRVKKK